MNNRRLYRSANDRIISGVAGGVADYFEVDPVLVRILWFISVPVTGGLTFVAYIVMMIGRRTGRLPGRLRPAVGIDRRSCRGRYDRRQPGKSGRLRLGRVAR